MNEIHLIIAALAMTIVGCDSPGGGDDDVTTDTSPDVADTADDVPVDATGDLVDTSEDPAVDTVAERECSADIDCDDSDPCTTDTCDLDLYECSHDDEDADSDGYPAVQVDGTACGGNDCDDTDGDIHPDAATGCEEGDDLDCDTLADRDEDADGYVADSCTGGDDCDDNDDAVFPGALPLTCSTEDLDCNGAADDDNDGDGSIRQECGGDDCDDTDGAVHPGATEIDCDGKDSDCVGSMSIVEDADDDGHPNAACAPAGVQVDCDDDDEDVYPGATEVCDAVDNDCDGSWTDGGADDDADTVLDDTCGGTDCDDDDDTAYPGSTAIDCSDLDHDCNGEPDRDNDGDTSDREACGGGDCDDTDATIHPGAVLGCDPADDRDCDTLPDTDEDLDGYVTEGCTDGTDCDDTDVDIHPGVVEICDDGVDQDCDTLADETGPAGDGIVVADRYLMDIAWTGSELAIARYSGSSGAYDFQVGIIDERGAVVVSDQYITTASSSNMTYTDMEWTGSEFGLVWEDTRDGNANIYMALIGADATALGSDIQLTSDLEGQHEPSLVWTGSEFGVAWRDTRTGFEDIHMVRVAPTGALIGSEFRVSSMVNTQYKPDIAFSGSTYGVAFSYGGSIYMSVVDPGGTILDSDRRISESGFTSSEPELTWTGSEFGVVYNSNLSGNTEVFLARADATGALIGTQTRVSNYFELSRYAEVAWTGSEYGVLWADSRDVLVGIYFQRVAADGSVLGSEMQISVPGSSNYSPHRLVWTGVFYAVAFDSNTPSSSLLYHSLAICP